MAKQVMKYESNRGKLFDTIEEAQADDYLCKVSQICTDIGRENFETGAETVQAVVIALRKNFSKLTKADFQKLIDTLIQEEDGE